MKTPPDRASWFALTRSGAILLVAAATCAACSGASRPPAPKDEPLSAETRAFLQARSLPGEMPGAAARLESTQPAEAAANESPADIVEVAGAVQRPGQLVIEPYAQTVRQVVEAMGGPSELASSVRIRPRGDVISKLFAETNGAESGIEIPVASLAGLAPIYVRPGDVIQVIPPPTPGEGVRSQAANVAPVAPAAEEPMPAPAVVAPQLTSAPAEAASGAAPPVHVSEIPQPVVQTEIGALRHEMEAGLTALRSDLERLRDENAKLRARLEQPPRPGQFGAKLGGTAEDRDSRHAAKVEARPVAEEKTPQRAEHAPSDSVSPARTVRVSGSVTNPGTYAIDEVRTVRGAVRAAGHRADANLGAVEVRPESQSGALVGIGLGLGAGVRRTVVDLVAVDDGTGRDLSLRGGEVIFVPSVRLPESTR